MTQSSGMAGRSVFLPLHCWDSEQSLEKDRPKICDLSRIGQIQSDNFDLHFKPSEFLCV